MKTIDENDATTQKEPIVRAPAPEAPKDAATGSTGLGADAAAGASAVVAGSAIETGLDAGAVKRATATAAAPHRTRRCMSRICNRKRIVWAKMPGYTPWPAQIVDPGSTFVKDEHRRQAQSLRRDGDNVLVSFFGTNDIAWLSTKATRPWKAGLKKKYHKMPKSRRAFHRALYEVTKLCTDKEDAA